MSRNSGGTYTLPAGNPVTTGTTISSTWANSTLGDIATALTDSLSRSGQGSMTAPLQLTAGAIGAPALTWALETTAGFYRAGAADIRFALVGADVLKIGQHSLTAPAFIPTDSTVPANGMYLSAANTVAFASNTTLRGSFNSTGNWVLAQPTSGTLLAGTAVAAGVGFSLTDGTVTGTITFAGTTYRLGATSAHATELTSNGTVVVSASSAGVASVNDAGTMREVGYRDLPPRTVTTNDNTAAADRGKIIYFTGGASTFTIDSDLGVQGALLSIINNGSGALTIAETLSGVMAWFNGTGAPATGSRSLAIGGVATVWMIDANNAAIWGTGLS